MEKTKKFILPLAVLISFSLIIWLVRPVYYQVKALKGEFKTKTGTLFIREKVTGDLEKIKETFEDLEEELNKVTYALPSEPETAELLIQLEALANENGLLLKAISFQEVSEEISEEVTDKPAKVSDEIPKSVLVNLQLTGTYEAFKNFLEALEKSLRIMDVLSIRFEPLSEELSNLYSFTLEIKAYWQ